LNFVFTAFSEVAFEGVLETTGRSEGANVLPDARLVVRPWATMGLVGLSAIHRRNRNAPSLFLRACGVAAALAGVLFVAWGYLHTGGDPYGYGDPYQPYLDSTIAALAVLVPALFLAGVAGLAGLHTFRRGRAVLLLVALVASMGFVLSFAGAAVGVVRGIEGALVWYDAYVAGRQNTTAFGLLVPWWIEWTPLLFAGLTMVGVAALGTEGRAPSRPSRALPLVTGLSGWAYYFTDSGGAPGAYFVHAIVGVVFGMCWVGLGGMLFRGGER
jgi:hypothetical protein